MQSDSTPKKPFQDLTGKTFGNVSVKSFSHITQRFVRFWACACVCGRDRILAEHIIKSAPIACKKCRRIKTQAKWDALKVSRHRQTKLEYLNESLAAFNYDPLLPWNAYPCLDWPFGVSVPKGNMVYGYGVLSFENRQVRVTRIVFERYHRKLEEREAALHHCDRPICYSPAHLFGGFQKDNIYDCVAKKRHCHGETSGTHILTEVQVLEIRRLYAKGFGQTELGRKFEVSTSCIHLIVHRKNWKHI